MFVDNYYKLDTRVQPVAARLGRWRNVETWEVDTQMPHGGLAAVRPQSVRQANLAAVLAQVRRRGPLSRSDVVAATGLTRSAIGGLVGELVDLGLVLEEAALSDGSPGRPSPVVRVDGSNFGVLAVEVGVDELAVALVALDGSVVRMRRVPRSRDRMPPSVVVADVVESVALLECRGPVTDGRRLTAVGMAVPGLIRHGGQVVAVAPNLEWRDVELAVDASRSAPDSRFRCWWATTPIWARSARRRSACEPTTWCMSPARSALAGA